MFNLFGKNYGKSLKQMMDELNEMMDETLNYDLHSTTESSLEDKVKKEEVETEDGEWIKTTYISPSGTRYTVTTTYLGGLPNKPSKKGNDTLSSLKNELEKCVENQDFEKAAQLRDQIKRTEINKAHIDKLEVELKIAIDKQDFEEAIKLRDKIKELKS
jgi:excinuclease UvrABC helicase subunit UvrB